MTEAELLKTVKDGMSITGTYLDDKLKVWILEVKEYLVSAGIPQSIVDSNKSAGIIARGVSDLWNFGGGNGNLSRYFYQRAIQLSMCKGDDHENV